MEEKREEQQKSEYPREDREIPEKFEQAGHITLDVLTQRYLQGRKAQMRRKMHEVTD